jgi:[calcium/calmodulin-dependent protein kinase] kinase
MLSVSALQRFHVRMPEADPPGVTLYCMLTGGLPFNTENPIELFERVQNDE